MIDNLVQIGDRRIFNSSLQGEDGSGILVRLYTGQTVEVLSLVEEVEEANENIMLVRAEDGTEFQAWETELLPHAQSHYVLPNGEYVEDPEFV